MRTIVRSMHLIDAPPSRVFELIDSPDRYPEFFVGITKWESESEQESGVGARYRVLDEGRLDRSRRNREGHGVVRPRDDRVVLGERHPSGGPLGAAGRATAAPR